MKRDILLPAEHISPVRWLCGKPLWRYPVDYTEPDYLDKIVDHNDFDPSKFGSRLGYEWESSYAELKLQFDWLFSHPQIDQLRVFVLAEWTGCAEGSSCNPWIDLLIKQAKSIPNIEAIFLGDVNGHINSHSFGDITSFMQAFPGIKYLGFRGGDQWFTLEPVRHTSLQALVLEGAYVPSKTIDQLTRCVFPELIHLEIWQGNNDFADSSDKTYQKLLSNFPFPKLRYLGIRNYCDADKICEILVSSKGLDNLEVLDLSLGELSDIGAEFLLSNPKISKLKKLILNWNTFSDSAADELKSKYPFVELDNPAYQANWSGVYLENLYCPHDWTDDW